MTRILTLILVIIVTISSVSMFLMLHMHNSNLNSGKPDNDQNQSATNPGDKNDEVGGDTAGDENNNGNNDVLPDQGSDEEAGGENAGDDTNGESKEEAPEQNPEEKPEDKPDEKPEEIVDAVNHITVGYLEGYFEISMAQLMSSKPKNYSFKKYSDTRTMKADFEAGKIDIITLPSIEGAEYQTKRKYDLSIINATSLNSLYFLEGLDVMGSSSLSLNDLDGKTIYTHKDGPDRYVLEKICKTAKLNVSISYTYEGEEILSVSDLFELAISGKIPNAILPEPYASAVVSATKNKTVLSQVFAIKLDLFAEWDKISNNSIILDCMIAKNKFIEQNPNILSRFISDVYNSGEYIKSSANIKSAVGYLKNLNIFSNSTDAEAAIKKLKNSLFIINNSRVQSITLTFATKVK